MESDHDSTLMEDTEGILESSVGDEIIGTLS